MVTALCQSLFQMTPFGTAVAGWLIGKEEAKMLTWLLLLAAAFVAGGFSLVASLPAAVIKIAFDLVPAVFVLSLIIGLGARNWGRCL